VRVLLLVRNDLDELLLDLALRRLIAARHPVRQLAVRAALRVDDHRVIKNFARHAGR
jgi:hypothetical protein